MGHAGRVLGNLAAVEQVWPIRLLSGVVMRRGRGRIGHERDASRLHGHVRLGAIRRRARMTLPRPHAFGWVRRMGLASIRQRGKARPPFAVSPCARRTRLSGVFGLGEVSRHFWRPSALALSQYGQAVSRGSLTCFPTCSFWRIHRGDVAPAWQRQDVAFRQCLLIRQRRAGERGDHDGSSAFPWDRRDMTSQHSAARRP
ncbi:hypothetical protein B0T11DRAFT_80203 [Plectosphaerella cucumerina]|uniref:Uncharacterized protein n=1 Tax=Plectosphaerella cucumerina TaxID=40658 RepID=A0A8K0TGI8_9PEZI|nr:hypothetical protein B0T11DRAFT_80203 [Plectosphaerella cucumerina]